MDTSTTGPKSSALVGLAVAAGAAVAAAGLMWWNSSRAQASPQLVATSSSATLTPTTPHKVCQSCGKAATQGQKLVRCGRCHKVYYCSRDCQRNDWNRGHKATCQPPPEPLPPWAEGLSREQYAVIKAHLQKNDEQFKQHLMQGGPKPDSVDGAWEGLTSAEQTELIDDSLWYKDFYKTNDVSRVPALLRRLAALNFFDDAHATTMFFGALFGRQSEDTLRAWADELIASNTDDDTNEPLRTAFLTFLRLGNAPACSAVGHYAVEALPPAARAAAEALLATPPSGVAAEPLLQPLTSLEVVEQLWGRYYATGDVALVEKLIREGLSLGIEARRLVTIQPEQAQTLIGLCNHVAAGLVNEGLFDEGVRRACEAALADGSISGAGAGGVSPPRLPFEVTQLLRQLIAQTRAITEQLASIPRDDLRRMRVEAEGHRPFLERARLLLHRRKVAQLRARPDVRVVPTQFGNALWLPAGELAGEAFPEGRLFMAMDEYQGAYE